VKESREKVFLTEDIREQPQDNILSLYFFEKYSCTKNLLVDTGGVSIIFIAFKSN
jgi:hypothetical protein